MEYQEGQEIWLKEDKEEGWPRQKAKFIDYEDDQTMAIVEVEPEEPGDDGLREISIDQIE